MQSVAEYAEAVGLSSSAVRARAARGEIDAQRCGRAWVILEEADPSARKLQGRPMSLETFDELARFLDGAVDGMSADHRRRARERAEKLAGRGMPEMERLAHGRSLRLERFHIAMRSLRRLHQDARLHLTGVSSQMSDVLGAVVDAYVTPQDAASLRAHFDLAPSEPSGANVVLRIADRPREVRLLHVIADLLDDDSPRSRADAERLLDRALAGSERSGAV